MVQASAETLPGSTAEWRLRLPSGGTLLLGGAGPARIMGILNVTPDSFSDGGLYDNPAAALDRMAQMAEEGADVIDVGGESTRPGAQRIPPKEQLRRILPVIEQGAEQIRIPISVDTTWSEVARAALDAGAQIINDISALRDDPLLAELAAKRGAPIILMHMQGTPDTMQQDPSYRDVVVEVRQFLQQQMKLAIGAGISPDQIILDPGFGFGKNLEHNLALLRRLDELGELGAPVMAGTSRKSLIGRVLGVSAEERLYGTLATVAVAIERGAVMVRVHDVRPALETARMMAAIQGRSWA